MYPDGVTCAWYSWCMICGVKVGGRYYWKLHEWESAAQTPGKWTEVGLLLEGPAWEIERPGPPSMTIPDETVKRYPAAISWDRLEVTRICDKKEIFIQQEQDEVANDNKRLGTLARWSFVVHSACHDIANRVMRTSPIASIRTIGDLYMTLDRRLAHQKSLRDRRTLTTWPVLPIIPVHRSGRPTEYGIAGYHIPLTTYLDYMGRNIPESVTQWWVVDPIHIPNLSASLLANLQEHRPTSETHDFREKLNSLPQELQDEIFNTAFALPLELPCNYLLPQSYWKQSFLSIPFLWDIERQTVDAALPDPSSGSEWDWEKITRQVMSQFELVKNEDESSLYVHGEAWDYSKVGLDVPTGLSNRRRIWQLLEDMYPNDVGYVQEADNWEEWGVVIPQWD